MDFQFLDALLDSVFVFDENRTIIYCNEAAASFIGSSVKRLLKNQCIYDVIEIDDPNMYLMPNGLEGKSSPVPYTEVNFKTKTQKNGRVQISIHPIEGQNYWIVIFRDVTLEEILAEKYRGELEQKEQYINQLKLAQAELEKYSKNLESMVEARTKEIAQLNRLLQAMMDSLGQGFIVFNKYGKCLDIYTRASLEMFQMNPSEKEIDDVLMLSDQEKEQFSMWRTAVFEETLPFDALVDLAPKWYLNKQDKNISLEYYLLRSELNEITNVVLVATDQTDKIKAQVELEIEKSNAQMILKILKSKLQFNSFMNDYKNTINGLKTSKPDQVHFQDKDSLYRKLHTLEGEAGAFSLSILRDGTRKAQDELSRCSDNNLNFDALKNINKYLEYSLSQFQEQFHEILNELSTDGEKFISVKESDLKDLINQYNFEENLKITEFIQNYLYIDVKEYLSYFNNLIESVSSKLGKLVNKIEFEGSNFKVDPKVFEPIFSSFVHIFRNIIDHGIEAPDERELKNKPLYGNIIILINYNENTESLSFTISDDGGGINLEKIKEKATEKLKHINLASLNETETMQLIFEPGFSTREGVGDFSGRGVGLDAVKHQVENWGGKVWIESQIDKGTKIFIDVPCPKSNRLFFKQAS